MGISCCLLFAYWWRSNDSYRNAVTQLAIFCCNRIKCFTCGAPLGSSPANVSVAERGCGAEHLSSNTQHTRSESSGGSITATPACWRTVFIHPPTHLSIHSSILQRLPAANGQTRTERTAWRRSAGFEGAFVVFFPGLKEASGDWTQWSYERNINACVDVFFGFRTQQQPVLKAPSVAQQGPFMGWFYPVSQQLWHAQAKQESVAFTCTLFPGCVTKTRFFHCELPHFQVHVVVSRGVSTHLIPAESTSCGHAGTTAHAGLQRRLNAFRLSR